MKPRRGITLIVVLVVVIVAALVGVGALDAGRAVASVARTNLDHAEARALADAGVRAFAEEVLAQREALLDGEGLELDDEIELWRDGDRRAIAILLPVGPEGERFVSEAAKLNVNTAEGAQLAVLPELGESLASAIVNARPEGGYASVADLLAVDGVTPELLFGERARWDGAWSSADDERYTPALADYLTVLSAEPNAQRGLGEINAEYAGQQRINLNRAWSEDIERELRDLFGDEDTVASIRLLSERGAFKDEPTFMRTLADFDIPEDDLRWILDLFTTTNDPFLVGRVDINRAPAKVIAAAGSLDLIEGEFIAEARDGLSDEALRSFLWLNEASGSDDAFVRWGPLVCVRSLQWRVRIMTGYVNDASFDELGASEELELERMRVTECVIDVAAPRPRLALLEDLTGRPLLASLMGTPEDFREIDALASEAKDSEEVLLDDEPLNPTHGLGSARASRERRKDVEAGTDPPDASSSSSGPPPAGVDRRTGRWTSGTSRGTQ